jgi:hypothetical protein
MMLLRWLGYWALSIVTAFNALGTDPAARDRRQSGHRHLEVRTLAGVP